MDDVAEAVHRLNNELHKRGVEVDASIRRQVEQVASDEVMVARMRTMINEGAAINMDQYMTIRAAYEDSRTALLGRDPAALHKIEVELIGQKDDLSVIEHRNRESDQLRARIAELEAKLAALEAVP
jgi:hypothetical protein